MLRSWLARSQGRRGATWSFRLLLLWRANRPELLNKTNISLAGAMVFFASMFLIRDAESSEADNKAILEVYKQLSTMKPPTGDEKGWKSRINNVIAAIQDVIDKKQGAVEKVRSVTECQGCHNAHRVGGNSGK